jgi:primosomal protein N' (replication factor Y)
LKPDLKVNSDPVDRASIARVALDVPIAPWFDYRVADDQRGRLASGDWVRVPWGKGERVGLVVGLADATGVPEARLRTVLERLEDAPALPDHWLENLQFASTYYHRGIGEIVLPSIPKAFRIAARKNAKLSAFARARKRSPQPLTAAAGTGAETIVAAADRSEDFPRYCGSEPPMAIADPPAEQAGRCANDVPIGRALSEAQQAALGALSASRGFSVTLLHGVTGSGKTEVYLRWFEALLQADPGAQLLLMVPEIALTPQLARLVRHRFGPQDVVVLHSEIAEAERARAWLAAADGRSRVVIGTRLAVLTPLPGLAAIVVDEEHDPSYRQQDGVHYSARDLAIAAARAADVPVVLGSATPSLESWRAARRGKYRLLTMPARVGESVLPSIELIDARAGKSASALAPQALAALEATLAAGEQALVFINRRGYAPVISCEACGWVSRCDHCSAWRVLHRQKSTIASEAGGVGAVARPAPAYRLQCHHCGQSVAPPRACPDCGNIGLAAIGRGTQRIEEELAGRFPEGRIARLDRDVAQRRGAAQHVIQSFLDGSVRLLVGTQMLAKGHDFQRLSLVVVVDGDAGLYSADFRAPERLFATLMQVAGRAGRDARSSRVLIQTRFPEHPLFAHLRAHDYPGFADRQLEERRAAGMPPFGHHALLRADATAIEEALAWLDEARSLGEELLAGRSDPQIFDPVPMAMQRLKGRERAQLLVEARSRNALHAFLERWLERLRHERSTISWQIEVDPAEI